MNPNNTNSDKRILLPLKPFQKEETLLLTSNNTNTNTNTSTEENEIWMDIHPSIHLSEEEGEVWSVIKKKWRIH